MRRKKLVVVLLVSAGITLLASLIWAGYEVDGTGFGAQKLWDWMELLIIPAALGVGAWWFNRAERKADREIAIDRQRETTLSTYFDRMSELLLKEGLRESEEDSEVRNVARARTVSAFASLDGERIAQVIRFLGESKLGGRNLLVIELPGVDLNRTRLENIDLSGANLETANLQEASLRGANLQGANLFTANLQKANLFAVNLQKALLEGANLQEASLLGANLQEARITPEQLGKVKSLEKATMPDGTKHEDWLARGSPAWTKATGELASDEAEEDGSESRDEG